MYYVSGAKDALTKLAVSSDVAVAALHGLGLTPVAVGADGITAPGGNWMLQPIGTTAAAEAMRRLVTPHAGRAGAAAADFLRGKPGTSGTATGRVLGELLGGGFAAALGAYGARRIGRHLAEKGDHGEAPSGPEEHGGYAAEYPAHGGYHG